MLGLSTAEKLNLSRLDGQLWRSNTSYIGYALWVLDPEQVSSPLAGMNPASPRATKRRWYDVGVR